MCFASFSDGGVAGPFQRKPGSDSTFVVGRRWSLRQEAGCGHWPEAIQLLKEMGSAQVRTGFGAVSELFHFLILYFLLSFYLYIWTCL